MSGELKVKEKADDLSKELVFLKVKTSIFFNFAMIVDAGFHSPACRVLSWGF